MRDVGPRCRLPPVKRLPAFDDHWPFEAANADNPPELGQDLRHAVYAGLVDACLHAAAFAIRPTLAVEEAGGPREIVIVQPRD